MIQHFKLKYPNEPIDGFIYTVFAAGYAASFQQFTSGLNPDMVFVKGGTFQMGSNENDREKPIHSVALADFYMGKHQVTVAEYLHFCKEANANWPEWLEKGSQYNINTGTDDHYKKIGAALQTPNHPIVGVSWDDAVAYCTWLSKQTGKNYRLPTEAQWEYAAGGGSANRTKWAGTNDKNELTKYAWFSKNSRSKTHPVGQKKANELGLYDMSGNVWEWCSDWYGTYPTGAQTDPKGADSGSYRVSRGGSWNNLADYCRVAFRGSSSPAARSNNLGFRLVFVP